MYYCMLTKSASKILNEFKRNIRLIDLLVCHRIVSFPCSFRETRSWIGSRGNIGMLI